MKTVIEEKVREYLPDLIRDLGTLVSYPTVYSEDEPPFGRANIDCLNRALEFGRKMGFKAVNVDNYAGYIEIGEGDQVIGIVGHLDVVPVSETWKTNPFEMVQDGDRYYGRGTSDDKGGVICGLYAMKILSEIQPKLNKRIRLIMGCNEESGSRGLRYYIEKEGYVDCGFTPDGSFPVVFGEKGNAGGQFVGKTEKIIDIKGGTVGNAVANKVVINLPLNSFDHDVFDKFINENGLRYEINEEADQQIVTVYGTAAHASTPEQGVNAISYAMEGLFLAGIDDEFVTAYHDLIGTGYYGEKIGLDLHDEYGRLTMNIGVIRKQEGQIVASIDIRFPVTMTNGPIKEALVANSNGHVINARGGDPLFFPLDHPMIDAMLSAYYEMTDSTLKPLTMGGGTYARTMKNIVAFGCDTQEYNWHIHDDNEFVTVNSLETQTKVYTQALINLLKI